MNAFKSTFLFNFLLVIFLINFFFVLYALFIKLNIKRRISGVVSRYRITTDKVIILAPFVISMFSLPLIAFQTVKEATYILQSKEFSVKESYENCPSDNVKYIMEGFKMNINESEQIPLKTKIVLVDKHNKDDNRSLPFKLSLEGDRIFIDPVYFKSIGYDVYDDQKNNIIVIREIGKPVCVVFGNTTRVGVVWHEDEAVFDSWLRVNGFMLTESSYTQKFQNFMDYVTDRSGHYKISYTTVTCQCKPLRIIDVSSKISQTLTTQKGRLQIPIRAFAGAIGANPKDINYEESFTDEGKKEVILTIKTDGPPPHIEDSNFMSGKYYDQWVAHGRLKTMFSKSQVEFNQDS